MWVLGPYPHSVALALITIVRRRRLVLGVRQDMPVYVRSRRPDRLMLIPGPSAPFQSDDELGLSWRVTILRLAGGAA